MAFRCSPLIVVSGVHLCKYLKFRKLGCSVGLPNVCVQNKSGDLFVSRLSCIRYLRALSELTFES